MGPITLENVRASSDITVKLRLKDGGMYIAWTSLADIKAYIFSDAQRAIAGRCDVSIDGDDSTLLICNYSANKPQYPGVNSIVIRANYDGRVKTYDRRAFNIVKRTSSVAGDVVLDDPVVDLELEVADVSSSLLDMAIALAFKAVEEWDQVTVTERGPEGKSAYRVAVDNGFVGTEDEWLESLVGPEGPRGRQGEEGDPGPAGVTSAVVTVDNTTGTPSATASVSEGVLSIAFSGLKGEPGPQGEQGIQGIQGPVGPAGVTEAHVTVDGTSSPNPTATAQVQSGDLQIAFSGLKGNPGEDGVGLESVASQTPADGTALITLTNGDTITLDLNHNHPAYYSKVAETSNPSGGFLPDVVYSLGTLTGTVTFALAAAVSGNVNHYFWMFDTSSTAPTITWPTGITWADGSAPAVAASKHYEISVLNGIAYYSEV